MASMFRPDLLAGERILVTGGGTGLGRAMTEAFLRHEAQVVIAGRRAQVLEQTADELAQETGRRPQAYAVDLRQADAVEAMVEALWDERPLTGLVNNAAGNFIARTEDLSHRAFDAVAGTVFHGTFYVTHSVGKRWIAAGLPGNVLSILVTWVRNGGPFVTPSAMSKAGIDVMTKSLAAEWGRHGVRLNAIAPGLIPTEGMWSRLGPGRTLEDAAAANPMRRNGEVEELTRLALFLIASDGCRWLTGETIAMDGASGLATGGGFYRELTNLADEDWRGIRAQIQGAEAKP